MDLSQTMEEMYERSMIVQSIPTWFNVTQVITICNRGPCYCCKPGCTDCNLFALPGAASGTGLASISLFAVIQVSHYGESTAQDPFNVVCHRKISVVHYGPLFLAQYFEEICGKCIPTMYKGLLTIMGAPYSFFLTKK